MSADLHTLTGAYAAHALSDGERLAFERHLAACPACAQEVRELTETAARLGTAVAARPSAVLWSGGSSGAAASSAAGPSACGEAGAGSRLCSPRPRPCWSPPSR